MAKRKQRKRIRSPHPGVYLVERTHPSGLKVHRAKYIDPDTGRWTYVTLETAALPTAEARTLWAKRKAKTLSKQRMAREAGELKAQGKPLKEALAGYLEGAGHRLRGKTLVTYQLAFARLEQWAEREHVTHTKDLTRANLASLRDYLIAAPKKAAKRGGKRGERKAAAERRSPVSVNRELRSLKTLLNAWRMAGLLPHVDRDAIGDTLKALPVLREQPDYLAASQLHKLLNAALRHDAAAFKATRAEHAGELPKGSTRRYVPIAPFAAFLLLTGCRRGEALGLRWLDVDLDALDASGRVVGEIRLPAASTKTGIGRTIGLEVSPALRSLLAAMKLRAGEGAVHVFEHDGRPYSADLVEAARHRMTSDYGAPEGFSWQLLRSTTATYLTNAPAIFGSATVFMSARQLGHSVAVAERSYLGVNRGIPASARTLEAAMQVDAVMARVLDAASGKSSAPALVAV